MLVTASEALSNCTNGAVPLINKRNYCLRRHQQKHNANAMNDIYW